MTPVRFSVMGFSAHSLEFWIAPKSSVCTPFQKRTAPDPMILWYPAIWFPQTHCIFNLYMGYSLEYLDTRSRSQTQCVLNKVWEISMEHGFPT